MRRSLSSVLNSNMFILEYILWPDVFTASYFREHRNLVKALSKLTKEKKRCGVLKDHSRSSQGSGLCLEVLSKDCEETVVGKALLRFSCFHKQDDYVF